MSSRCFNHNPVTGDALRRVRLPHAYTHFSHKSGIGPARDVPAPPSARGVRTRKGRNVLRPTGRQAHPQHEEYPSLRPVNTEPTEARGHGGFLELAYAHLNHIFVLEKRGRIARNTFFLRPLSCRPKGVSVCSVVKKIPLPSGLHVGETARKPVSKNTLRVPVSPSTPC